MPNDRADAASAADAELDLYIQRIVDAAPPFTPERIARLRAIREAHLANRAATRAEAS